jgi:hypothetical protein
MFEALACAPAVQKHQERSPAAQGESGADPGHGRAHGGKARRSLARQNPASPFLSRRGYRPSRRSSRQTAGCWRSDDEAPSRRRPAKFAEDLDLPAGL